ncbi:conserved hypothetical protein [Culex quinquefasciatus]|uniref:C2H2-type domain-containing protein n=1 Tax=Culex quinquefasciatus TaxID=7176 RepID=B0WCR6_CULQU|nr:conserved hypothetical protein [Culex quinquefasciatus]|eukprot:XP_001846500.1 conserved hypothetical protein [Culex quinquefasciatus]
MEVKPFPCKVAGCKASFATEDHLNAHQAARHDESGMLNLELANKSNLFADQTPTPTRLIGKCEEVGLFEDLQNVNPFEETFRRAVEEKSEGAAVEGGEVGKAGGTGDDTLHTPHVFPLLERRESIKERTYKLSKLVISRSVSRKDEVGSGQPVTIAADLKRKANDAGVLIAPKKVPVAILPKATPVQPDAPSSISAASSDPDPDPVKVKLKKYLARNGSTPVEASKSTPKKVTKQSTDTTKITKLPDRNPSNSHEEDKEKTEKHERWKAAAKRYRTRLKQNQDMIAQRNAALEEENARLKAEVVRLRNLLQLHRDCPVARALPTTTAGPSKVPPPIVQQPQQPVVVGKNPVYIVIAAAAGSPPPGLVVAAPQNHPTEKRS